MLIEIRFFMLKSHNKATLFEYCHLTYGGGLFPGGGGGGTYNRMYFLFPGRWAYNLGGRGAYNQNLTVSLLHSVSVTLFSVHSETSPL